YGSLVQHEHTLLAAMNTAVNTGLHGSVGIVRFIRPAERNALSLSTLQELQNTLSALTLRRDIRAIIFIGTDDIFLSGADIRELAQLDPDAALAFSKLGQNVFQIIADAQQIAIAAINGHCMGGGLDLALACDIRVASKIAVFSQPGARLGIITGWGGTQRLPQIIGRARALEFFATAGHYTSKAALEMGLVSAVADPVLTVALERAEMAIKEAELELGLL
ncbi:MAG: enoyl-CoA hydratase/isomerase family protein, partial [Acidobacteriota bacterium]|nr:enoyl-CoA hydratase/isomerase family protein [Acidobacteriota bacterium]